ncbi:hypothetical protein [Nostoc sp.]|uniref:hypothetical protein n=1 Tax=Nostoc sp. TaxID=1180 RepID=UPI002FF64C0A
MEKVCELLTLSFPTPYSPVQTRLIASLPTSTTERRSHWSQLRETESRYITRGEPNELD